MARVFVRRDRAGIRLAGELARRCGIPDVETLLDALVAGWPGARPLLRLLALQERCELELDRLERSAKLRPTR